MRFGLLPKKPNTPLNLNEQQLQASTPPLLTLASIQQAPTTIHMIILSYYNPNHMNFP